MSRTNLRPSLKVKELGLSMILIKFRRKYRQLWVRRMIRYNKL